MSSYTNRLCQSSSIDATAFTVESLEQRRLLSASWGWTATSIHQDQAAADFPAITGAGQKIVMLDSGAWTGHPNLGGRVTYAYDFYNNQATPTDNLDHGTGTTGIAAGSAFTYGGQQYQGVAPGANIIVLKIGERVVVGPGNWSSIVSFPAMQSALQWVIAHRTQYNIAAVNMSLATVGDWYFNSSGDPNTYYKDELQQLSSAGVFLSAAGGGGYPAVAPEVVGAGGTEADGSITSTTGTNSVELLAPGDGIPILSADPTAPYKLGGNGVSYASPWVAGAATLLKQVDPAFTPAQILSILQDSGTPDAGFKLLNLDAAIRLAYQRIGATPAAAPVVSAPVAAPLPAAGASSVPNSPFAPSASATSATSIAFRFYDNSDDEMSFVIERSVGGGAFSFLAGLPASAGRGYVTYNDTTASPGTTYAYRVKALDGVGQSNATDPLTVTTPSGAAAPAPAAIQPTAPAYSPASGSGTMPNSPFAASASPSAGGVALQFYDNSDDEGGFIVQRAAAGGDFQTLATLGAYAGRGYRTWVDGGAAAGTYVYRVAAINGQYTSNFAGPVTATSSGGGTTTAAPPATSTPAASYSVPNSPFAMSAAVNSPGSVAVQFYDNSDDETGFVLERSSAGGPFALVTTTPAYAGRGFRTIFDPSARAGNIYTYRVKAVNVGRESNYAMVTMNV